MIAVSHISGNVKGTVSLPSSKSISNRILIIRAVSGHDINIKNLSEAEDTVNLEKLLNDNSRELHCGEGGTTFRFLLAFLALRGEERIIYGSERLNQRPVKPLVDALNSLGAHIEYTGKKDFPPLHIHPAVISGGKISIDASVSSQFISALLLVAPSFKDGLVLSLENAQVSRPYIKMTIALMQYFGADVTDEITTITVRPSLYINGSIKIEQDWSSASYWFSICSLAKKCNILLQDLTLNSMQGDAVIALFAGSFGLQISEEENGLRIKKNDTDEVSEFRYDFKDCPDLVPTLAILCAAKAMKGTFTGIHNLRHKESDRAVAIKESIELLGGNVKLDDDSIVISPAGIRYSETVLPVYNDHRMAMSFAPLALHTGKIFIENGAVTSKSYPDFWLDLLKTGFVIENISK